MISTVFIRRPILATVLSLVISLGGLLAMANLPIAQYPDLLPVTVNVTASYMGASPEVISQTVGAPIEQQVNGVKDMLYMTSTSSSDGSYSLDISFSAETDPDIATINVNNRVQAALPSLPMEVRQVGVNVDQQSPSILLIVAMFSPDATYNIIDLSNYALINVLDELKRVEGVGSAAIFGARDYSMRIWLKPDIMAQLGLSPNDVNSAIQEQNAQFAAGRIGQEPLSGKVETVFQINTKGRLSSTEEFGDIIIRANPDGSILRLKDVARIELGAMNYDLMAKQNGKDTVAIGVYLTPGANALSTADRVMAAMQTMSQKFPEGIAYDIPYDTTTFVRISIEEVVQTLLEALFLVFCVVFLFLQDLRATIIPILAVPVSIIGTFAGMMAFGFSINTLTLFGMVLAIGIVVDDAIVVLENVDRIMIDEKLDPYTATAKAMAEVTGPVIAIVLVLCSVFVPVTFLGGLAGAMYKQFAVTIAVSVTISGFVALTLTPALCAMLLHVDLKPMGGFFAKFNEWFKRRTKNYTDAVAYLTHHRKISMLAMLALFAVTGLLFKVVPGSLVPDEDQGYILAATILPDGATTQRTLEVNTKLDQFTINSPLRQNVITLSGFDILSGSLKSSSGVSFITLKPWDERKGEKNSSFTFANDVIRYGSTIPEGLVLAFNPPPISGMSNTGGFELFLQNRGAGNNKDMEAMAKKLVQAASERPELTGVSTTFSTNVPQIYINLDRDQAKALGVPISNVFNAMQSTFGSQYVNDFNLYGRTFKVISQAEDKYRSHINNLNELYVQSSSGNMIPMTSLAKVELTEGPDIVNRFNVFPAAKIVGNPAPGYSSGQAINAMEETAKKVLSTDYDIAWTGSAYQEKATGGSSSQMLLLGLLMVFLILAAQYEKWTLPLAVIAAVPFAVFGAIAATWLRGLDNDVYMQIALVTLVGLSAKNSILIVEFALARWESGLAHTPAQAAIEAAGLRFRPIIMTSLAFILGCVPLAISSGAGAASRHAIGTGVIGGMLASTFISTLFVPLFFTLVIEGNERLRMTLNNLRKKQILKKDKG